MNRLAVIIPFHTVPDELEKSLLSLLENRPDSCEIIVVQSKLYENPYELKEDEVHFLTAIPTESDSTFSVTGSILVGLQECNSTYVYIMPAGVQYQPDWLTALEILEKNADLGAFFLDEDLMLGGFFRKNQLENFLSPAKKSETEFDCFINLVSSVQKAQLACGLAEFEITEEVEPESIPEVLSEEVTVQIPEKSGIFASLCAMCKKMFR